MSGDLPPALAAMREQFREAATVEIEVERRVSDRLRRGRGRRWGLVALAALAAGGGVAGAARVIDTDGPPLRGDALPKSIRPSADPGVISSTATPDPVSGPPWALRVFTTAAGKDCVAVGRYAHGTIGRYTNHEFRAFPKELSGACDDLSRTGFILAQQSIAAGGGRTIVYGLSRDGQPVTVTVGGVTHVVRPRGLGGFLDVRSGPIERGMPHVVVTTRVSGRTKTYRLG